MVGLKAQLLNREETLETTIDARIVALRWDLLAWCLVLDCDVPAFGEMESNVVKRVWVAFDSISEISLTLDSARLPTGIHTTHPIWENPLGNNSTQFNIGVLTPKFSESDELLRSPHGTLKITAKAVLAVRSIASGDFGETAGSIVQRNSLADDNDFLEAIRGHV